ncbi:MAG: hypothetical protein ACYCPM_01810 [Acidobacteriaceae bacterium]
MTGATRGFKNWFGILGGQRNRLHQQVHPSLACISHTPTVEGESLRAKI